MDGGLVFIHGVDAVASLEVAGDGSLGAVAGDTDPVFGVMTPPLEEGAGLSVLEHAGGAHDDHRVVLLGVYASVLFEVVDVPVFKGVGLRKEKGTSSL